MRVFVLLTLTMLSTLVISHNVQAVFINEIMPNPFGGDNEWVEIYNPANEKINFTAWRIMDNKETDEITCYTIENCSLETNETYILITGRNANISEITNETVTYFYVDDARIGNYLNNGGDNISIYNSTFIDSVSYTSFSGKVGYSWTRMENGSWFYCDSPTPGEPNMQSEGNDTEEDVNETDEDGNETNQTNNLCDLSLAIESGLIFNSGEKHDYYLWAEDSGCGQEEKQIKIEYWIEDLFGSTIKSKYTTKRNMTCSKNISRQWTPKDLDGSEAYYIRANITDPGCNDTDHSNNYDEKLIVVKGSKPPSDPEDFECSCETPETSACSCGPCPPRNPDEEETEEEDQKDFEILSYPEEIEKDKEIETEVRIKNPSTSTQKNYTIYSYVYEGNQPISFGFDGENWLNTWDANKQNFSISGNSSLTFTLKNRIANDTEPGEYNLRVRMWLDGKKHDLTKKILIKEPSAKPANETIPDGNETHFDEINETNETAWNEPEIRIPTGEAVSKPEENWFSAFFENVINFFKNLFNL